MVGVTSSPVMPESDPRRVRLGALREQLETLGQQINAEPMGTPQQAQMADRYALLLSSLMALREGLEGADYSQ